MGTRGGPARGISTPAKGLLDRGRVPSDERKSRSRNAEGRPLWEPPGWSGCGKHFGVRLVRDSAWDFRAAYQDQILKADEADGVARSTPPATSASRQSVGRDRSPAVKRRRVGAALAVGPGHDAARHVAEFDLVKFTHGSSPIAGGFASPVEMILGTGGPGASPHVLGAPSQQ